MPLLELSEHLLQLVRVLNEGGASGDHRVQSLEKLDAAILRNRARRENTQPPGVEGSLVLVKRLGEVMARLRRGHSAPPISSGNMARSSVSGGVADAIRSVTNAGSARS